MRLKSVQLCSTALIAVLWSTAAVAQDPGPTQTPTPPEQTPVPPPAEPVADDPATPEDESEDIVVTGIRRSIESSQTIKRESEAILDSIVAEDIGKLPDITASASLARLPGVQVNRAAGEAAQVQVRGLPDISTTYNGREIFTAEGRFVAIQDFPAGQVAALEVYKSSTANLIEGGIGGQVNVRGRRPFDFKEFTLFGSANGLYFEQSRDFMVNANLLISNRWETGIGEFGALLSVAYAETKFLDSSREAAQFVAARPNFATPDFRFPDSAAIFYGRGDRWRPSVTAALQWKPTPDLEFYADGLFQGFRGRDANRFLFVPLFGNVNITNLVRQENDPSQVQSFTISNQVRPDGFQSANKADTNTYQIAAGAIFTPDRLRLSADVAYTDSTFTATNTNVDFAFASAPTVDVDFDVRRGAGGPVFDFRDFDTTDPSNYIFRGLFDENLRASGKDFQARLDAQYETSFDFLPRIDLGIRYNDREVERLRGDNFVGNFPIESRRFPLSSLGLDLSTGDPGFRFDNLQRLRLFVTPTRNSIRDNADNLRALVDRLEIPNADRFGQGPPPFEPLQTFNGDEKAYAGYAQGKYQFELGGEMVLDGVIGLRAVRTETSVSGTTRTETRPVPGGPIVVTFTPVEETRRYTDYLPNASARLVFGGGLQARLGFTKTRTRPNFDQLNPSSTITPVGGDNFVNVNSGNPDLDPLRSTNYDASLEYYFSRTGSATLAVFRRDVRGFISGIQTLVNPVGVPTDANFVPGTRFNRPENGGRGRLQGFEAAFTTTFDFDFVPEWAKSFGFQANYTYNDATSALPGNTPPSIVDLGPPGGTLYPQDLSQNLPGQQRLAGVSKHSYNVVGFYETPKFSTRLAYNFRSDFVTFYRNPPNFPAVGPDGPCCVEFDRPEIFEGRGVLDFSATVTPTPAVTIAFDVGNVLGNPIKLTNPYTADRNGPSFPLRRTYLERAYSLGVRFRF